MVELRIDARFQRRVTANRTAAASTTATSVLIELNPRLIELITGQSIQAGPVTSAPRGSALSWPQVPPARDVTVSLTPSGSELFHSKTGRWASFTSHKIQGPSFMQMNRLGVR